MKSFTVIIGCDNAAVELKEAVKAYLDKNKIPYEDMGCDSPKDPTVYPEIARRVCERIMESGYQDRGILICGTGIGISISANKIKGIRAALCHDCFSAQATREHNDANMLAMGARVIGPGLALKIVDIFLDTPFSNDERHVRRIGMIE